MTLRWHPLVAGVCLLTLTGCTSDESGSAAPGGGALNPGGDEGPPDGLGGEREFPGGAGGGAGQTEGEAEDPPVGRPDPVKPSPGQYGAPCDDDDDCTSQVCVPDADAGICSLPCLEDCLPFYPDRNAFCRSDPSRTEAVSFVCYPEQDLSCEPCVDDSQCDGGACLDTPDGKVCGQPCGSDDDCKTGFSCGAHGACKPISGSCTCTPLTDGRTRVCTWSNDFGTCAGEETCNAAVGWVGCTAAEPAAEACDGVDDNCNGVADDGVLAVACARQNEHGACQGTAVCQGPDGVQCLGADAEVEVCDGIDNDCDGAVDEGFVDDRGGYGLLEHCGGCNRTCEGRFSFAEVIVCDADRDPPACVVGECADGHHLLGESLCVPLADVSCNPCHEDADCAAVSPGAACLQLGDPDHPETLQRVCGRDCAADGPYGVACPDGFLCRAMLSRGGREVEQCVPTGGTCACRDNPDGFSVPCQVTNEDDPGLVCEGRRGCDGDGFGDCAPPPDRCDGLDNDCDGVVDNGLRDPDSGRYDQAPEHCGRCNRDCAELQFRNADSVCDVAPQTPECQMVCWEGFVDLDNGSDDGCECEVQAELDLPDGDDQDCDGIDGEIDQGVFVSKIGRAEGLGSIDDPVNTVQRAIDLADEQGFRDVYVATGVYSENIDLREGVNVFGGYSFDFRERDPVVRQTTLLGVPLANNQAGLAAAVQARGVLQETRLEGFSIYGPPASRRGRSSFGIYLVDCDDNLAIRDNVVFAGSGGDGARGAPGVSGGGGGGGGRGEDATSSGNTNCGRAASQGGAGGRRICGGVNVSGGAGGESHCPLTERDNGARPCQAGGAGVCRNSCDADPCNPLPPPQGRGEQGLGVAGGIAGRETYDRWSDAGVCQQCGLQVGLAHTGADGTDGGRGGPGVHGKGCSEVTGTFDDEGDWQSGTGGNGGDGTHGSGGGGGSAGAGYDTVPGSVGQCSDNLGGSGGGGGGGGCRGTAGGGGTGGGGAFAILIRLTRDRFPSLPTIERNALHRGRGGDGANGGSGGVGGRGGLGAIGGLSVSQDAFCTEPGGRGGNGGPAGPGGGGGGGCGGATSGLYLAAGGNDAPAFNAPARYGPPANTFPAGGRGGRGGQGGGSTGNPGEPGQVGLVADIISR